MHNISKTRFVAIIMSAVMLMLTLAACDSGGGGVNAGKSNADLLKEGAKNMRELKSYHLVADVKQGTETVTMKGDIDVTNKKAKLDATMGGKQAQLISVGGKAYASEDGGKTWKESPTDISEMLTQFDSLWKQLTPEEIDKAKDKIKDGTPPTEKIDGVDSKHMMVSAADLAALSGGVASEGSIEFWVSTDASPHVRQLKMPMGTITWTKINEAVTIEAPQVTTP